MKNRRPTRAPRPKEFEILNILTLGPRALASGPVGRCSRRGWIRYVGMGEDSRAVYEITALGQAELEEYETSQKLKRD